MRRLLSAVLTAVFLSSLLPLGALASAMPAGALAPRAADFGAADHLVITQDPTTVAAGSAISPGVTIEVRDAADALVADDTTNVTIAIGTNGGGGTLSGTKTLAAVGGVATFSDLTINKPGTDYTLVVSDLPLTGATSAAFVVTAGAADHLTFTQDPTTVVAGSSISPAVTVEVRDALDNLVTGNASGVTIGFGTNAGDGTLSGTKIVAASGGVATFGTLSINKVGTAYTLAVTDGALTGATSAAFDVSPAAAVRLVVTTQPSTTVVAGVALATAPVIKVEDAFGNIVTTDSTTTVTVALTTANGATLSGTRTRTVSSGVASFPGLSISKSGSYTLTATAAGLTSAVTGTITVSAAAASQLVVAGFADPVAAGVSSTFTVAALDSMGNIATGYTGTVHFTSTDQAAALPVNYTFTGGDAGDHTFTGTLKTVGTQSITANDGTLPAASQTGINVNTAPASQLVVTTQPSTTVVAGVALATAPVIKVEDAFGNIVTTDSSTNITVALTTPGGATLSGTKTVQASSGIASFPGLSINKSGSYTLTATAAGLTSAVTGTIAVSSAAATRLAVTTQPSTTVVAGVALGIAPVIKVEDAFGNVITTDSSTSVTVALTTANGATLSGTRTRTVSSGIASFPGLSINKSGSYTLTATAAGLTSAVTGTITVSAAAAVRLVVTTQPSTTVVAGVALATAPVIKVEDAFGNVITGDGSTNITVALTTANGATLSGTRTRTVSSGIASFPGLSINKTGSYTLTATAAGLTSAVTGTIVVKNSQIVAFTDVASVSPVTASLIDVLANDNPGTGDTGQPMTVKTVTQGSHGRVTTDGATVTYDPSGCYVGSDLITYTASDGLTSSTTAVLITIVRPGQTVTAPAARTLSKNPIADAASLRFIAGSTMGSTVPMRLGWCGVTAGGSSVLAYKVYQSTDGGTTFGTSPIVSSASTSSTRGLAFRTHYAWRLRVVDSARRIGGYGATTAGTLALFQDSSASIVYSSVYSSRWLVSRVSSYSGGTERYATSSVARATITFTNVRGFAVIGSRSKGRGSFRVYVDGVLVGTVSQRITTAIQYRRVLFVGSMAASVSHTIKIQPSGNGRIDLDAIVALS